MIILINELFLFISSISIVKYIFLKLNFHFWVILRLGVACVHPVYVCKFCGAEKQHNTRYGHFDYYATEIRIRSCREELIQSVLES